MGRRKGNGLVQHVLGGGTDNGYMSDLLSSGLMPPPLDLGFAWESLPLAFCLWFPGKTRLLAAGSSGSQLPFPDPSTPGPRTHTYTHSHTFRAGMKGTPPTALLQQVEGRSTETPTPHPSLPPGFH